MKSGFDRRRFLQLLSLAGVSVHVPACSDETGGTTGAGGQGGAGGSGGGAGGDGTGGSGGGGAGAGKKVIVVGGGLGGLSAAYELMKKGFDVTVLEAQARAGGRVHTLHDAFQNGQYAELGAVRVPDVHEHTLGYIQELGLELLEFGHGDPLYYIQGKRFVHKDGDPWPLAGLTAEEQMEGLGMWSTYVAAYFDEFGDPRKGEFPKMGVAEAYDAMSWTDFLKSKGASDDWIALYTTDNGTEISKIGAMAWMAAEVADQAWDKTYYVKGGNDQIPKGLAAKLGDRVLYERPVKKIEHSDVGVKVHFDNKGAMESMEADHLVLAVPFTTLRKVEISPAFPMDKKKAIDELFMMSSSRGYFQTKTRFWQKEGIGGIKIAKTDTKAERLWDLTNVQPGDSGIIMVYTQHQNAADLAAIPAAQREAFLLEEVGKFFPDIADEKIAFAQKIWAEDPWVEGSWTDILPNQWWMFPVIGRAEGRVHFAGEHTSIWAGWMQGAIESGKRAAHEIAGG